MSIRVEGQEAVKGLFASLGRWVNTGARLDIDKGAKNLADASKKLIRGGLTAGGSPLPPLAESTLNGPIRASTDKRLRRHYGSRPLSATGALEDSISVTKPAPDTWEIGPTTPHGKQVLASNAKAGHSGRPFHGDTHKPVRDPLQVTDKQVDIIEDALVKGIERVIL